MPDNYDAPERRNDRLQAALQRYQDKADEEVTPFAEQVRAHGHLGARAGEGSCRAAWQHSGMTAWLRGCIWLHMAACLLGRQQELQHRQH